MATDRHALVWIRFDALLKQVVHGTHCREIYATYVTFIGSGKRRTSSTLFSLLASILQRLITSADDKSKVSASLVSFSFLPVDVVVARGECAGFPCRRTILSCSLKIARVCRLFEKQFPHCDLIGPSLRRLIFESVAAATTEPVQPSASQQ